ncbi:hypothetical protein Taro_000252 [Colocasia esculenta]|uniref:Uncharacterized protein n=1 Tax=Colocasia esculenta TaxID=4460 RepID=A0A843TG13_COLES|nr:hypothetical protein [Colocasia esculenta]
MSLHLVGVVWRSSWRLGSRRSSTPSHSTSPSHLLRPAQTVHLKSTKGSCGGVLGGWGAGDRPHQAVLLPLLICCDLHKPST